MPLALGPHASGFAYLIEILEPGLGAVDRGLRINPNGVSIHFVNVFTMASTATSFPAELSIIPRNDERWHIWL